VDGPWRKLQEKELIQGKSGGFETVVHTRFGLQVAAYFKEQQHDAK